MRGGHDEVFTMGFGCIEMRRKLWKLRDLV